MVFTDLLDGVPADGFEPLAHEVVRAEAFRLSRYHKLGEIAKSLAVVLVTA